jgi:hypothetical protein
MPQFDSTGIVSDMPDKPLAGTEGDDEVGPFVLNLCPVSEPIAIPRSRSAELTKFTFFCSRGWEGNVEQWWLHMGNFATRADAEKWLVVLQRIYPQASVTPAEVTFAPEHHAAIDLARRRKRLP